MLLNPSLFLLFSNLCDIRINQLFGGYSGGLYGGYGYGYWGKRDAAPPMSILNRTECIYNQDSSMLSCHGSTGVVECKTELINEHPIEFSIFGIGLLEDSNESIRYRIIPRKLDNSGWESGMYEANGEKKMVLLYADKSENLGLKVRDVKCFEKMSELFAMSPRKEQVELSSELSVKPTAMIIGDLTLAREMTEEEEDSVVLDEKETKEDEEIVENGEEVRTERVIVTTESLMKELAKLKLHINSEWELTEQNTQTLVDEINHMKQDMSKMLELIESFSQKKVEL